MVHTIDALESTGIDRSLGIQAIVRPIVVLQRTADLEINGLVDAGQAELCQTREVNLFNDLPVFLDLNRWLTLLDLHIAIVLVVLEAIRLDLLLHFFELVQLRVNVKVRVVVLLLVLVLLELSAAHVLILDALDLLLVGGLDNLGLIDERELTLILVVEVGVLTDIANSELWLVFVVLAIHLVHARPVGDLTDAIGLGELLIGQVLVLFGHIVWSPALYIVVDKWQ